MQVRTDAQEDAARADRGKITFLKAVTSMEEVLDTIGFRKELAAVKGVDKNYSCRYELFSRLKQSLPSEETADSVALTMILARGFGTLKTGSVFPVDQQVRLIGVFQPWKVRPTAIVNNIEMAKACSRSYLLPRQEGKTVKCWFCY